MKLIDYMKDWFRDFWKGFGGELRTIFSDGGVMIIFTVAGLGYPILYNYIYLNGTLDETPIAVVDDADCFESREYIRQLDATREVDIAFRCENMAQAQELMAERKVNGIVLFPSDFGEKMLRHETATLSIYADMSSFLYYKNLLMSTNMVMLDKAHSAVSVQAVPYEENIPYNKTFAYNIFLLSAIFLLVIQQVMFYGMCMVEGTKVEENRLHENRGGLRIFWARSVAYWLIFMGLGLYIACIVPAMFGLPQRGSFGDIFSLLALFVTDCVFFCMFWSTFFRRRESVFVLYLFMSPVCIFLTGFSWPASAIPGIWKVVSYFIPTTFGCRAFINMNTAGAALSSNVHLMWLLLLQTAVYMIASGYRSLRR